MRKLWTLPRSSPDIRAFFTLREALALHTAARRHGNGFMTGTIAHGHTCVTCSADVPLSKQRLCQSA